MAENLTSAKIIAHSIDSRENELISFKLVFPRFILSEFNKHRMLSSNTSSSRAIPLKKMIKSIQEHPFIPMAWQRDHKGMQGTEYFERKEDISIQNIENIFKVCLDSSMSLYYRKDFKNCLYFLKVFMENRERIVQNNISEEIEILQRNIDNLRSMKPKDLDLFYYTETSIIELIDRLNLNKLSQEEKIRDIKKDTGLYKEIKNIINEYECKINYLNDIISNCEEIEDPKL